MGASYYASLILATPGLIDYWRFEGTYLGALPLTNDVGGQPAFTDATHPGGSHSVFTDHGIPFFCWDQGTALNFDAGAYLTTPVALNGASGTIECWLRHDDGIAFGTTAAGQNPETDPFSHRLEGDSLVPATYTWTVIDGSGEQTVTVAGVGVGWRYWALTWDQGNQIEAYLDGASAGTAALGTVLTDRAAFVVGPRHPFLPYFKGIIDELAVYDRVLSAATIAAHFAAGTYCPPGGQRARVWVMH